jgi:hypothetical protein
MLRRIVLVRTDVSKELSASFIRVTRIGEIETMLAVTSNRRTLRRYCAATVYKFFKASSSVRLMRIFPPVVATPWIDKHVLAVNEKSGGLVFYVVCVA